MATAETSLYQPAVLLICLHVGAPSGPGMYTVHYSRIFCNTESRISDSDKWVKKHYMDCFAIILTHIVISQEFSTSYNNSIKQVTTSVWSTLHSVSSFLYCSSQKSLEHIFWLLLISQSYSSR